MGQNKNYNGYNGKVILSTDLNEAKRQSFVFAFANTSEIAIGYFYHGIHGVNHTRTRIQSIKWFWQETQVNQIPGTNTSIVPLTDPCIIVQDYTVFVIGGKSVDGYVTGTWFTTFDIIQNQVRL